MKYEISVAIPTYNSPALLKETLDSILNQTYPAAEIVVVDDGSTDHTPDVLASYGKLIKSLRIDNGGPSMARKVAAEATTSPWLAFCDHDDLWLPNHLEKRVALLKKYPDVNFSFSNALFFGPTAVEGTTLFDYAPDGWWENLGQANSDGCLVLDSGFYLHLLRFNPVWPTTTVMSRALYDSIGGIDPRYSRLVNEDADMTRKAVLHGNSLCDFTTTAMQRRHAGNTSGSELKTLLGKCQILKDHMTLAVAPIELHDAITNAINSTLHEAFVAAYYAENKQVIKEIAGRLGFANLSIKNQLRFIYLFLRTIF
jgi:glycosyltransferase involved in cell wall biosynthesis